MKELIEKLMNKLEEKSFVDNDERYKSNGELLVSISDMKKSNQ